MFKDLASRFRDEFHQLERALFSRAGAGQSQAVQFTSSHFGEGVTSTTLALAWFLASQHSSKEVIVVEANLRQPSFVDIFALKSEGSLLAVLQKSGTLGQAIQKAPDLGFSIIRAGQLPATDNSTSFDVNLDRVKSIIAALKKKYRYILVDSPPVVPFIDATSICRMVDGVVLVVESEKTRSEVVDHAIEKLKSEGAQIMGTILNKREFHIPKRIYRFL
jgi:capsular exopolysaccharide synthesis family protein